MGMRHKPAAGTEITLPITPMLDMSFQLLFFFISTFKLPTGMEGSLDLLLPSQATPLANDIASAAPASSDKAPDFKSIIPVDVKTPTDDTGSDDAVGDITTSYKGKNETLSPPWSTGKTPGKSDMQELIDKLQSYLDEAQKTGDTITSVKIQGVSRLKFRAVVRVMDACRRAGLKDISFAMPSDYVDYMKLHP